MRRLSSLLTIILLAATPTFAQAQQPPRPTSGIAPAGLPATAVAPTPATAPAQTAPPVVQSGRATAPQAPRASAPRAPQIASATNKPMPAATNIRLELLITDTFTGTPVKKSVSLLILTGNSGMIRTMNTGMGGAATLDVDAIAAAYQNGMVATRITFQYQPAPVTEGDLAGKRPPTLNESITVVLMDGKPMAISQSADPATDRKVTAELTATILK